MFVRSICCLAAVAASATTLKAQKGYEFEVYDTHLAAPKSGGIEFHTNFVAASAPASDAGMVPLRRAFRSAFEISAGLTPWMEASLYTVGYARSGRGLQYVGNRARVTTVLPQKFSGPLRLGLSQEIGYARSGFAEYGWAYEISPIAEAVLGPLSLVVNPALERGLGGPEKHRVEFEPRARMSYAIADEAALSLEYYGGIGPVLGAEPSGEQHHQLFIAAEAEVAKRWEVGLSVGRGLTRSSDRGVIATKLEYSWGK